MRLETERLFFRHWEDSDAEDLYKIASNPEVGPPAGWPPHKNVEESLGIIHGVLSAPEAYAICLKEDGKPIGTIDLRLKGNTDLTDKEDECEMGYWLARPYWGQGIMTEAAEELLRHAFEDLGMTKVWCGYYDGNEKSKHVQEKCGFTYQWTTEGLEVKQMNEIRTGHVNMLTKKAWEARR